MSKPRSSFARLVLLALVAAVVWTGAPASAQTCTTLSQTLRVRDVLFEYYYWYHELPDVNPARYSGPEAYLDAVRYKPLDTTYSYITSAAESNAFFSDSQFIGFGFSMALEGAAALRILQVFPDSPAADAGLARGDRIVAVNDRSVQALVESGEINTVFGPSEVGYGAAISVERDGAEPYATTMIKRVVTIPTVSLTKVFEVDGRRVGYVLFRNFVEPSVAALDQAFDELRAQNVTELVLDLRYNGGGLVSVAQHLASLIGGTRTRGLVLGEYFHNDKNTARNKRILFEEKPNALALERLFVIATRSTASASELIVNGLRPFMPVTVVGGTTYGKPVGQYGFTICDKILFPVAFTIRNANGQADYFTGIPADCTAADDASHQLGDASESSLAASLELVRTGTCPGAVAATPERRVERERRFLEAGGFRALVNAY